MDSYTPLLPLPSDLLFILSILNHQCQPLSTLSLVYKACSDAFIIQGKYEQSGDGKGSGGDISDGGGDEGDDDDGGGENTDRGGDGGGGEGGGGENTDNDRDNEGGDSGVRDRGGNEDIGRGGDGDGSDEGGGEKERGMSNKVIATHG